MKKGFTLVEILIVIGVFGILMIAGTDFLIQVVRNGNQAAVQNEVRQNASKILQDISASIRNSSCVSWQVMPDSDYDSTGNTPGDVFLRTYSDNCTTLAVEYQFVMDRTVRTVAVTNEVIRNSGKVYRSGQRINSNVVAALDCTGASQCGTSCVNGLTISGTKGTNKAVTINLTVQATTSATRADFCGVTKLSDTITPRGQF